MAMTTAQKTDMYRFFSIAFNAAPGVTYMGQLETALAANMTTKQVVNVFTTKPDFLATYPTYLDDAVFAAKLIENVVGTSATQANKDAAIADVIAGLASKMTRGDVVYEIFTNLAAKVSTDAAWGATATMMNNKVAVAAYYTETLVADSTNLTTLRAVLANVTATTDVTAAGLANSSVATATGQTFTLTKSVQALAGTSGNDTFIAGDEGGSATLNAGDQIVAGAGTDTLKLFNATGALNAANFAVATISGVENVEATLSATTQTLDVSANADVKKVSLVNGFDGTVTLKAAQTAGLSGGITTTAAATFTFSDVTGGADTVNLELNAADLVTNGSSGLTIAGVETLNIAATGANLLGATTLAATTKLVITGAGSLSTTLASTLAKTIDGSAATGNLTIVNIAATAAIQSIKTGTGNDTYTTVYADLTKDDAIDLGTGTDSLRFSDSATFNDAATSARLTKVAGVEQLGVVTTATTLTVDGDFVSQTSYYVAGATAKAVLNNVANNADVNFGVTDLAAGATGVNTVAMKLGANTLNVNLTGSKTAASVVGGVVANAGDGLAVTGSATINVKSAGVDGAANNVLDLTAADNQSVVVTGSQNLTLTAKAAIATTGFSIDGSAFTGKLTVTGTAAADIIKGGSGADTISGGTNATADTLTGGAGNDKFVIIAGITAATADVITDFVTKADTIGFGTALAASGDYTEATAAVADFTAALAAANLVLTSNTAHQVNVQQVGADSWVFYNNGTATGADQVVKLTGVALTAVEFADIVA